MISKPCDKPKLPLPAPLRGLELGTFSHYTLTIRMPGIVKRVIQENNFSPEINESLQTLLAEIPFGEIRRIIDPVAPDCTAWERYTAPYIGLNWLQAPWFFCEHYLFRRILETTRYFQPGETWNIDPYRAQKEMGLQAAEAALLGACEQFTEMVNGRSGGSSFNYPLDAQILSHLLMLDLWGNQADLSMWPAGHGRQPEAQKLEKQCYLLINDSVAVTEYMAGARGGRIDCITDNTGFELMTDLLLAEYLLGAGWVEQVRLCVKPYPTFVSDVTQKDIRRMVDFLTKDCAGACCTFGNRLKNRLEAGALQVVDDLFWVSPLPFWQAPEKINRELASARLLICKGDANYRRLIGDLHWPYSTPVADVMGYLPAPLVALRVLKSDACIGLKTEQVMFQDAYDPQWKINGKWGIIVFTG